MKSTPRKSTKRKKAKSKVVDGSGGRHPKRPPIKKRGNRVDFTKSKKVEAEPGSLIDSYNQLPWLKCPQCKRKGKRNIWKNGDVFFTHRLIIKEGRPRSTDFCYIGKVD
jgi:hypothetical protein